MTQKTLLFFASFLSLTSLAQGGAFDSKDCESYFTSTPPLSEESTHLSAKNLSHQIGLRRIRVPEFQYIREEAQKIGLRVWLFGGTAAGFSHYVKWDLLRERGDRRFEASRFDYDYTNIYRHTQDLDIVIDGTIEQAKNFESKLKNKFPYISGAKEARWEVRSLRQADPDKGGLLNDFGFMNQHTDSNSTGMVELTDPPLGEAVIRDLRDWNRTGHSHFLQDIANGNLTFYYSPRHDQTLRALNGQNPAIFSVIRALTKAFQYDLKIKETDFRIFQKIIKNFNPSTDLTTPYAADWLEKNGKKLLQNTINVEHAWDTLEALDLRKKLILVQNNSTIVDSLAWWMSKEPLRSYPVGKGMGRTAAFLGIKTVSHETRDFQAFENINRSKT